MVYTAPTTNTNFWITFLLTRLLEALSLWRLTSIEHQIWSLPSLFWPQFHAGSQLLAPAKNYRFLRFIHTNNNLHQLLQTIFLGVYWAITISLIPLETILPEKSAFIIDFSCTVWTKMRSLAGSLAYGMLDVAILIPPRPPIPPTNIRKVRGR